MEWKLPSNLPAENHAVAPKTAVMRGLASGVAALVISTDGQTSQADRRSEVIINAIRLPKT